MISVRQLSFKLESKKYLLHDVSLDLNKGEILTVLGPNGAGKSTLLKLLSGEYKPTSGLITLNGENIQTMEADKRAREMAVLPQDNHLTFPFPVFDVVLLGRLPYIRTSTRQRDSLIALEALRSVSADHLIDRQYSTLSGGEKQRVQLARILAQLEEKEDLSGKVLLLDEPTSALDLAHQHQVLRTAEGLARRGVAVLAVLHDLNLAAQYSESIIVLHEGRVVASGDTDSVIEPGMIKEVYGVQAYIHRHPVINCPLISTMGRAEAAV